MKAPDKRIPHNVFTLPLFERSVMIDGERAPYWLTGSPPTLERVVIPISSAKKSSPPET